MKTILLRTGIILGMMLSCWSCRVDDVDALSTGDESSEFEQIELDEYYPGGGKMVLGKQLENAYSVENMKIALANLTVSGRIEEDIQIETTDLYIRLLPKDSVQVNMLESDTTLNLFDHPLDYEIEQVGSWYHDPTIPDHMPTWQYTVVKPDFEFPDVEYEVLADLFLMDENETSEGGRISLSTWYALEEESLRLTGMDGDEEGTGSGRAELWCRSGSWNPNGRIRVMEMDQLGRETGNYIPVWGVEVQARRHFFWSDGTTDGNGYFRISKRFSKNVYYRIKWRVVNRYKITNAWGFSRTYNRPGSRTGCAWELDLRSPAHGREVWAEASMACAARRFHYEAERHGLKTPNWARNVRTRLIFKNERSNVIQGSFRHNPLYLSEALRLWLLLRNDVRFFVNQDDYTPRIYQVMMHELGHMSHVFKSGLNFQLSWIADKQLVESWGTAVEYYFTLPYYPNRVSRIPTQDRASILFPAGSDGWRYTPFFIDLIDNSNQRANNPSNPNDFADDRVFGYSLSQIQQALDNRTTMRGVQEYLRNNYSNSTENEIERLRAFYNSLRP